MAKSVRSARGASVDFDLLKIKQQISTAPQPQAVAAREDFIDQKFKRKIKKLNRELVDTDMAPPVEEQVSEPVKEDVVPLPKPKR